MANDLFVSYDLSQPDGDDAAVRTAIGELGTAVRLHDSLWYVSSRYTALQARDKLSSATGPKGTLVVIDTASHDAVWKNIGDNDAKALQAHWNARAPSERKKYYVGRIEQEHDLMNHRLMWLFISQTIFVGIYVNLLSQQQLTVRQAVLACLVVVVAFFTCVVIYISIFGAVLAANDFRRASGDPKNIAGSVRTYRLGLVAPIGLPLILILFWLLAALIFFAALSPSLLNS